MTRNCRRGRIWRYPNVLNRAQGIQNLIGEFMKTAIRWMAVVAGLFAVQCGMAQAPAGATGQCKDGTYSTAASKQGACHGHQGVKEWYATAPTAPTVPATPATAPAPAAPKAVVPATPAASPAPAAAPATPKSSPSSKAASMAQQPGGGPGLVWVNTSSNVYHCYGSTYYGKTKEGAYMSEADAKAKGAHADHGHACTK